MSATRLCALLTGGYLLAQWPLLGSPVRYHGDEKYYTDAALRMLHDGEYVTPRYDDGTIRLRKPVLTYWVLLAGWHLGGVGYAASRLPMLLAAGGILCLTYGFTRGRFGSADAGLLAVALLVADQELFTAAWRQNPDALLTLFVTLALTGFAAHGFSPGGRPGALLAGYLGAGLAMATKGFLGVAVVAYALLFFALDRRIRRSGARIDAVSGTSMRTAWPHVAGVLLAVVVGGGWYAAVCLRHGPEALMDFLRDQAALDAEGESPHVAARALAYLGLTLGNFLPAALCLAVGAARVPGRLGAFLAGHRGVIVYTAGWFALVWVIFSLAPMFRPRYLLPAHPLAAALAGAMLAALLEPGWPARWMGRSGAWIAAGIAAAAALAFVGWRLDARFVLAGLTLTGLTLVAAGVARPRRPAVAVVAGCAWIFGALWTYDACIRPIYGGGVDDGLARRLDEIPSGTPILAVGVPERIQAQIPVISEGRLHLESRRALPAEFPDPAPALLLPEAGARDLPPPAYRVYPAGESYRHIDAALFWGALRGEDREALLESRRRRYVLAVPNSE